MFITFEGIGGTGKTTQIAKLREYLEQQGRVVVVTREPGGSRLGQQLRAYLLANQEDPPAPMAELLLFMAARAEHVAKVIKPALAAGKVVISDRFVDSSVAYQAGGHGLPFTLVRKLNGISIDGLWPDVTVLLDMEPRVALQRARQRDLDTGKGATEGRFTSKELAFHHRVRDAYLGEATYWLECVTARMFHTIDAEAHVDTIQQYIRKLVDKHLNGGCG